MAELPRVIGGYEIISRLGQGGMGSLYLAKDPKIGRLVAIKLVRQEFDSPDARQRFAREAQAAGTLRHPNIVTIFDVDEHGGQPYIAMEYVDGETLSDAAAQATVTTARALFEQGDKDSAIAALEAFAPSHDLVSGFLASLRGEQVAEARQEPTVVVPATGRFTPNPSTLEPDAHRVSRTRTPIYAALALAVVVLAGAGSYVRMRGSDGTPAPAQQAQAAAPTSAAPAAAIPPPIVVAPPASLTAQPPQNQNDRDAMAAYRLLSSGQHAAASAVVAQIAKRDPRNENLKDLRTQIQAVADAEQQRAAAVAPQSTPSNPPASGGGAAAAAVAAPPERTAPAGPDLTVAPSAALPSPSNPPVVPLPAEIERPAIEASIHEYARALSSRNLPAVARVRRYTPAEAKNWENIFKQFAEYRLIVKVLGSPTIAADHATIPVEEQFAQTAKKEAFRSSRSHAGPITPWRRSAARGCSCRPASRATATPVPAWRTWRATSSHRPC